ncbi:hypothetical protein [Spiroplasma turonicum]|uniref:Transmembrane protein n=1 Tax=Spiroplasma turonicum TaxID=216946 RepID=A0A0K1P5N0_9MOLU|nr:hypothetical protein [Spiroplasma turonicum]AKU79613.1 hypothetical protein STURON_00367 [Spiroplasma turonicum]ALX70635.1 hypothetical protein STURO_v1c03670 [Spiroplasma turonicum]
MKKLKGNKLFIFFISIFVFFIISMMIFYSNTYLVLSISSFLFNFNIISLLFFIIIFTLFLIVKLAKIIDKINSKKMSINYKDFNDIIDIFKNLNFSKGILFITIPILFLKCSSIFNKNFNNQNLNILIILMVLISLIFILNIILFSLLILSKRLIKENHIIFLNVSFIENNIEDFIDSNIFFINNISLNNYNKFFNKKVFYINTSFKIEIEIKITTHFSTLLTQMKKASAPPSFN